MKQGLSHLDAETVFFTPEAVYRYREWVKKTVKKEKCNHFMIHFSIFLFVLR